MRNILTTTALASALAFGTMMTAGISLAQDSSSGNKPCVGENCPAPDMQNSDQGTTKKRLKGVDQNNQGSNESTDQTLPRKKKAQGMDQTQEQAGDQTMPRKKKRIGSQQNNDTDVNVNVDVGSQSRVGNANWHFDPSRHERRRSRSATFRFFYGGYWYAQPYWQVYSVSARGRVSCGEGREIVAQRFNRVRVIECNGGTYTYLGRLEGDTFRVLLNSRTGRIVGRAMI